MTTVPTRRAAALALTAEGVTDAAAELILAAGAAERHAARVAAAAAAAAAACGRLEHLALVLDAVGVGGTRGLDGAATVRLPPFGGLGSGRKQARDGEAWSAALRFALLSSWTRVEVDATPEGVRIVNADDRNVVIAARLAAREIPPEWAEWTRALAGRALLALARGERRPDLEWLQFAGEARDWAAIFNAAEHEMQVARAVARIRAAATVADAAAVATDCCRALPAAIQRLSAEEREVWERLMAAG
jgi:hypothetical protein